MPPNFEFEFVYFTEPRITVRVVSPVNGQTKLIRGHIDTGAQATILDASVARDLGLELSSAATASLTGLGGQVEARFSAMELRLLDEPELTRTLTVAFIADIESQLGNLIGLDVLEHFDFALSHSQRTGYLGRSTA